MTRRCMRSCGDHPRHGRFGLYLGIDGPFSVTAELYRYLITDALREETVPPRPEEAAAGTSAHRRLQRGRQRDSSATTPTMNRAKDGAATPTSPFRRKRNCPTTAIACCRDRTSPAMTSFRNIERARCANREA